MIAQFDSARRDDSKGVKILDVGLPVQKLYQLFAKADTL